jgi:hypothetical protein
LNFDYVDHLVAFNNIHTLVLEQTLPPGCALDHVGFSFFLVDKGRQMKKLCLRVNTADLADLYDIARLCPNLRVLQFFAMTVGSGAYREHCYCATTSSDKPRDVI